MLKFRAAQPHLVLLTRRDISDGVSSAGDGGGGGFPNVFNPAAACISVPPTLCACHHLAPQESRIFPGGGWDYISFCDAYRSGCHEADVSVSWCPPSILDNGFVSCTCQRRVSRASWTGAGCIASERKNAEILRGFDGRVQEHGEHQKALGKWCVLLPCLPLGLPLRSGLYPSQRVSARQLSDVEARYHLHRDEQSLFPLEKPCWLVEGLYKTGELPQLASLLLSLTYRIHLPRKISRSLLHIHLLSYLLSFHFGSYFGVLASLQADSFISFISAWMERRPCVMGCSALIFCGCKICTVAECPIIFTNISDYLNSCVTDTRWATTVECQSAPSSTNFYCGSPPVPVCRCWEGNLNPHYAPSQHYTLIEVIS